MSRMTSLIALVAVGAIAAVAPRPVAAQGAGTVECASEGGARKHCSVPNIDPDNVTMDEKLSQANCFLGESWGADAQGVWVSKGCRARFGYITKSNRGNSYSSAGTIECASEGGDRKHCSVPDLDPSSVTMDEKLSHANCILGESWGTDAQGIWVSKGCRARFGFVRKSGGSGQGGHRVSASEMKTACAERASREWGVTESNLEVTVGQRQPDGTTEVYVRSKRTFGSCYVDQQGRITRLSGN